MKTQLTYQAKIRYAVSECLALANNERNPNYEQLWYELAAAFHLENWPEISDLVTSPLGDYTELLSSQTFKLMDNNRAFCCGGRRINRPLWFSLGESEQGD